MAIELDEDRLRKVWYAKPNDLIGGWCVMDVDLPPSVANRAEVCDIMSEGMANHIVKLHNDWLESKS